MKKIILAMMIFSFILVTSGIVLAADVQVAPTPMLISANPNTVGVASLNATTTKLIREKISNPGEIKLFEQIQKIGNDLFGTKKQIKSNVATTTAVTTSGVASTTKTILEKISNPGEVKLFEKIQKIGSALWGFRKIATSTPTLIQPEAVQCVKDAINKKDTAIKTALSSQAQTVLAAIDSRTACQSAALDQTTGQAQADANKVCVDAYTKSIKDNNNTLNNSKNDNWKIYKSDLKACSIVSTSSSSTSDIMINDGEITN
jgi:hypothetical protein